MNGTHIIEPESQGTWIAAAFIVALLALVVGAIAIHRINVVTLGTQTEVLFLSKKIEQLKSEQAKQAPVAPAAAPSAPAATAVPSK